MLRALALVVLAGTTIDDEPVVRVEPKAISPLAPGESKELEVEIAVADGFKVQANPAANEFLIPLELELESDGGLELVEVRYPQPQLYRLKGAEEDLLIYDGELVVSASIRASATAEAGAQWVRGRLSYQACNEKSCLAPASSLFLLRVVIEE